MKGTEFPKFVIFDFVFFKPTSDECIVALCMPGIWP